MLNYNLELKKAVAAIKNLKDFCGAKDSKESLSKIKKTKAKTVLIQLPDGLKPKAMEISDFLEKHTKANIIIWSGSCFGSCDIPPNIKDIDLCISFGHSVWPFYKNNKSIKQTRKQL